MSKSKKPDRLERAVDALIDQAEDSYLHRDVLTLLRREQRAQRARVVRIVTRMIVEKKADIRCIDDGLCDRDLNRPAEVHAIQREIQVCDDLLAKLHDGKTL